jgi:DNA-binding SARP family transcriptional activator/predicted ATPase
MGLLTLRLFGGFEARLLAGRPLTLPRKKARALLAYLALRQGQPQPRDKVTALLWGDKEEEQARHSLRQAISTIKKTLSHASPKSLVLEGDTIALAPSAVETDAVLFERFVAEGSPSALERATQLYRGEFLEGLDVKEEMFEEWLMTERERLRELALDASAKLLSHQLKNNLDEAAIQTALHLLHLDPLQESVHQILMRLYSKNGRRSAALMQYQRCIEVLQRELGVEPEPETKQVYQDILQRVSRTPPAEITRIRLADRRHRKSTRIPLDLHTPEIPLIGRKPELVRLREAMKEARKGRGQTIVILGEAGVGKSRLVQELSAEAVQGGSLPLLGRSYEIEQALPFGPWNNILRSGRIIDDPDIIQSLNPIWRIELARLFPELGAPGLELSTAPESAVRLFEAVAHLLDCLVSRRPLLLILEDLHWADEMSLRLFSFLSHRIQDRSVLLVGTAREEEVSQTPLLAQLFQELEQNSQAVSLTVLPLSQADTGTLVRRLAQASIEESLLARLEEGVWASSEGNPFIVVETMQALHEGHGLEVQSSVSLPEQVCVIVTQRLERLSDRGKQLVAAAAIIGREFDFTVLERAAALGEREASDGVEELVRRRVFHSVEELLDFTHDRIREVAYTQILPPRRKRLHASVAKALEDVYAENLEPHYAALGVHYREGGVWEKATLYLHKAGVAAVTRSAHREAVEYFNQALESLKHLPENRQTIEQAIAIRVDLGPALMATRDYFAPEVEQTYTQARELCERFGESPQVFPVLWGLWLMNNHRGEHQTARELGRRLLDVAEREQDISLLLQAHHALWATLFGLGELASAWAHLEQGLTLYNPQQHRHHAALYGGHDPGVCCGSHAVRVLWLLGYPDQAIDKAHDAVKLARELSYPYSLANALSYSAWVHQHRNERQAAQERAQTVITLATEHGFPRWVAQGTVMQGWLLAEEGRWAEGIAQMRQGAAMWKGREQTYFGALVAEAYRKAGHFEEGLSAVTEALARVHEIGSPYYEAELHRIKGELLLQQAVPAEAHAQACFQSALEVSRQQKAKSLELRAAMSLSRLWQKQSKQKEARQLLSEIYGWFTEGFDTADLKEASALLNELS